MIIVSGRWAAQNLPRVISHPRKVHIVTTQARFPTGDEEEVPRELAELGKRITSMNDPMRAELELAYHRVVDSVRRRRRILSLVQEALAQLRLDIKYLMFDLEVTRQERDELKQQLEDK